MRHESIPLTNCAVEIINISPEEFSPLISKCEIKVCYVSDEPNRNNSIITKETAKKIAPSLRGAMIVGKYNENKQDFNEHDRIIEISNGEFKLTDNTHPYGFVDLHAKVWFQKFLDDSAIEREYLVTEGWLWTGQYPEVNRILTQGNNQSMELNDKIIDATWTKDSNGSPKFFIINDAIISKLCILGEDCEPCFEGAQITAPKVQFSFNEQFTNTLFSMMTELKELLTKGGSSKMASRYNVAVGDNIWNAIHSYARTKYPDAESTNRSVYAIDGVYEDEAQKYAVLKNRTDNKFYRINFSLVEESNNVEFNDTLIEITSSYEASEEAQFAQEDVDNYENNLNAETENSQENEGKTNEEGINNSDNTSEGENASSNNPTEYSESKEVCEECGKPKEECVCEKKSEYHLEEIPEYVELQNKFSELESKYNALLADKEALENDIAPLKEFKLAAEKKEKEAMINSFYMLSDEDKKDVIENINTYSLNDIEAKLSIICVRNKVDFNLDNDSRDNSVPTVYSLEGETDETPAWVKRALSVAKTFNN